MAIIDAPFLAWYFSIQDAAAREMAFIDRKFRGFGREVRVACHFTERTVHVDHLIYTPDIHGYRRVGGLVFSINPQNFTIS